MNCKRILWILFWLMPFAGFCADALSLAACNQQYAKGQFDAAKQSYQNLVNQGLESSALYFNLGNACYKTGDIPSAILYYEKAKKLAPDDEDIAANIRFVNSKITDKIDEAPEIFLSRWWHNIINITPLKQLTVLSIVFILLASGSLIYYLFVQKVSQKKVAFYLGIGFFVIGIITIFLAGKQSACLADHRQAIVFSNAVTVKSSPEASSKAMFVLHAGTKVSIIAKKSSGLHISLTNGAEGWLKEADVKEI